MARKDRAASKRFQSLQRSLGKNVRALREKRGWTQDEAAWQCRMSIYQFQLVEWGDANATLSTIAALADGFDVEIPELFDERAREEKKRSRLRRGQGRRSGDPR